MRVQEGLCVLGALFDCLLDLRSGECNVFVCVVLLCLMVFGETIRNVCGCSFYFVVECYGCV